MDMGDDIRVVRRPRWRSRYMLAVARDGVIEARVPAGWSERQVGEVLARHRLWVARRRAEMADRRTRLDARAALVWCELPDTWWRKVARRDLWRRLDRWAAIMGVDVRRRRLTGARTRWGSCNSRGDISLSWRLMLVDEDLRDYVVIHELAHRRHMDHSARFWAEVGRWCPDYDTRRRRLRQQGGEAA